MVDRANQVEDRTRMEHHSRPFIPLAVDGIHENCRGAGNNTFRRNMRELIQTHKPGILILMETKVQYSYMGNFFSNMGFSAATIVNPVGRSGGV
ncbi:hypothetical protein LOK49_LG15G01485 [Camellia lanceoleosa]|uniref:Uncharacterized protein n=1 Tax=Camellia lanceoleosa TaxID=1840588 RepID=A0ACC0F4W8_9ERIC|nr:hypothetical protein LOK49_LG15G01485 [Camellia lanceoleosa]